MLQRWLDRLVEQLRRQGLPSSRVDRLVVELTDHANDLLSENKSMDAEQNLESRLGTPEQLAAIAKVEFQRTTFAGRHPLLTFVWGPVISMLGLVIGAVLATHFGTVVLIETADRISPGWLETTSPVFNYRYCQCLSLTVRFVPLLLSTWIFTSIGRRSGLQSWSLKACGIIAITALFFSSVVIPKTDAHHGQWIPLILSFSVDLSHVIQAVVPLAIGSWMYWSSSRSRFNTVTFQ